MVTELVQGIPVAQEGLASLRTELTRLSASAGASQA